MSASWRAPTQSSVCAGLAWALLQTPLPASAAAAADTAPHDVGLDTLLQSPAVTIANGEISARIFVPDASNGFYRGTRFDWAGVIGSLQYRGHDYYVPWFRVMSPPVRDFVFAGDAAVAGPNTAATGPVEEFNGEGGALGYAEAKPGGSFVKIGVGVLQRPDGSPFSPFQLYPVIDHGQRTMQTRPDSVSFTHTVADPGSGYAYRYTKTLRLLKSQPVLLIEHELRNTGKRLIATQVYNHNFLNIDGAGTSAGLVLSTPFALTAELMQDPQLASIAGNRVTYAATLVPGQRVSTRLTGYGTTAADYDFRISDLGTGAGLRITADQPLDRVVLWSIRPVMAIEPFVKMAIPAGQTFRWTYRYEFEATRSAGSGS